MRRKSSGSKVEAHEAKTAAKPREAKKSAVAEVGQQNRDDDTFIYEGKGLSFSFILPNENTNSINLEQTQIYRRRCRTLFEAARRVRGQSLFGDSGSIDKLINEVLIPRYSFVPFGYQIKNVLAVLNRFDGKAVLGDQVGLGKTVEALMTADAMFACGVIRNALIVVPRKTVEGWINEIETKFAGIFTIRNLDEIRAFIENGDTGYGNVFENTVRMMEEYNAKAHPDGKPGLYIIVDEMINDSVIAAADADALNDRINNINRPLNHDDEQVLGKRGTVGELERELMAAAVAPGKPNSNIIRIFEEYGYRPANNALVDFDDDGSGRNVFFAMSKKKCERAIAILGKYEAKVNAFYTYKSDVAEGEVRRRLSELKNWLNGKLSEYNSVIKSAKDNVINRLYESGGRRIIDLLVVDEVHSFYNKNATRITAEEILDYDKQNTAVDFLSKIEKKFCVLMSATPVRTKLEDVFDLVWIADRKRFGDSEDAALRYFYTTICRLPVNAQGEVDAEYKLSMMIDDPEGRRSFFGLINNFFTRKRINDVDKDMEGAARRVYATYDRDERRIIEFAKDDILEQRSLMHRQNGDNPSSCAEMSRMGFESWMKNDLTEFLEYHMDMEEERDTDRRHTKAAINRVLMDITESDIPKDSKRRVHRMVDWRRPEKEGILVSPPAHLSEHTDAAEAVKCLREWREDIGRCDDPNAEARRWLGGAIVCYGIDPKDAKVADRLSEVLDRFCLALENEPVLIFDSRISSEDNGTSGYSSRLASRLVRYTGARGRSIVTNPDINNKITDNSYNQIAIVGKEYQAGVNLQQYRTLIFSQMDVDGERLLEPVDIEQWIGRIHRTGQVKNCRIITVPVTNMKEGYSDPEPEFLKWYYSVLSDPQGLDLFGNSTPDIAFIQPVAVDKLKRYLTEHGDNQAYGERRLKNTFEINKLRLFGNMSDISDLSARELLDTLSFSQLLELCYYYDAMAKNNVLKDLAVETIRNICNTEGFGKVKGKEKENG